MRKQHDIVGTLLAGSIDGLLDEFVEGLRLQVVEQDAVGIVERVALEDHRLRRAGSDEGHLLVAILMDDVGGVDGIGIASLIEVGTDHRRSHLFQQCPHAWHTVIELMVAQREGVIVHEAHDVGNILAFGDGARSVALQEVTHADSSSVGRIRAVDGIAQTGHLRIAVDAAMYVVLVKNHNALGFRLSRHRMTPHHQGHHTK